LGPLPQRHLQRGFERFLPVQTSEWSAHSISQTKRLKINTDRG
jgi:hypothetical protein